MANSAAAIKKGLTGEGLLKCTGGPRKDRRQTLRRADQSLLGFDRINGITERCALARLKDSVTAGNCPIVVHRQARRKTLSG